MGDVPTYQEAHAKETLAFTSLPALRVKGKAKPAGFFAAAEAAANKKAKIHSLPGSNGHGIM